VEVAKMRRFEEELTAFVERSHPDLYQMIREKKELSDDVKARLIAVASERR
jgi:F0F1-type ATP synthase alpha subunit